MTTRESYLDGTSIKVRLLSISNGRPESVAGLAAARHGMLDNLLAVIHRDGGDYIKKNGYSKASIDAERRAASNQSVIDEVRSLSIRALSLMDDDVMPYSAIEEIIKCLK